MKEILLHDGNKVIVDDGWYEMLKYVNWSCRYSGRYKYAAKAFGNSKIGTFKQECMHSIICDIIPNQNIVVDHINRDTLDNRCCNLRLVTKAQNSYNAKAPRRVNGKTSKYKGVWNNGCSWSVGLYYLDNYFVHCFDTEEEAGICYNWMARKYVPSFAVYNEINNWQEREFLMKRAKMKGGKFSFKHIRVTPCDI